MSTPRMGVSLGQDARAAEEAARVAINAIAPAAVHVANALNAVSAMEDERALIKPRAIKRLMEAGAATSVTGAEKIVEQDAEYASHRDAQREAELEKQQAYAAYEAARLTAQLAVGLATAAALAAAEQQS